MYLRLPISYDRNLEIVDVRLNLKGRAGEARGRAYVSGRPGLVQNTSLQYF
jgi:hypothetical protein